MTQTCGARRKRVCSSRSPQPAPPQPLQPPQPCFLKAPPVPCHSHTRIPPSALAHPACSPRSHLALQPHQLVWRERAALLLLAPEHLDLLLEVAQLLLQPPDDEAGVQLLVQKHLRGACGVRACLWLGYSTVEGNIVGCCRCRGGHVRMKTAERVGRVRRRRV